MLSDNASTYLSAAQEIRTLFDTPEIREYLAIHRVQWTFIPKRAPWFGGFWERLIGLTKNAIKKTLGRALISFDELSTVITEIETALNDRPLTYVSSDLNDKVKLVYGNDELVRSAELITTNGPTNRPIHKLYPLEVVSREFGKNTTQTTNDHTEDSQDTSKQTMDRATSQTRDNTIRRAPRDASVAARLRIADLI
jgi:hypothetical protein